MITIYYIKLQHFTPKYIAKNKTKPFNKYKYSWGMMAGKAQKNCYKNHNTDSNKTIIIIIIIIMIILTILHIIII